MSSALAALIEGTPNAGTPSAVPQPAPPPAAATVAAATTTTTTSLPPKAAPPPADRGVASPAAKPAGLSFGAQFFRPRAPARQPPKPAAPAPAPKPAPRALAPSTRPGGPSPAPPKVAAGSGGISVPPPPTLRPSAAQVIPNEQLDERKLEGSRAVLFGRQSILGPHYIDRGLRNCLVPSPAGFDTPSQIAFEVRGKGRAYLIGDSGPHNRWQQVFCLALLLVCLVLLAIDTVLLWWIVFQREIITVDGIVGLSQLHQTTLTVTPLAVSSVENITIGHERVTSSSVATAVIGNLSVQENGLLENLFVLRNSTTAGQSVTGSLVAKRANISALSMGDYHFEAPGFPSSLEVRSGATQLLHASSGSLTLGASGITDLILGGNSTVTTVTNTLVVNGEAYIEKVVATEIEAPSATLGALAVQNNIVAGKIETTCATLASSTDDSTVQICNDGIRQSLGSHTLQSASLLLNMSSISISGGDCTISNGSFTIPGVLKANSSGFSAVSLTVAGTLLLDSSNGVTALSAIGQPLSGRILGVTPELAVELGANSRSVTIGGPNTSVTVTRTLQVNTSLTIGKSQLSSEGLTANSILLPSPSNATLSSTISSTGSFNTGAGVAITAGTGPQGGGVQIAAGFGTTNGGTVEIRAGGGVASGAIRLLSGNATGSGPQVTLGSGSASEGGEIAIRAGNGTSSGGAVLISSGVASSVQIQAPGGEILVGATSAELRLGNPTGSLILEPAIVELPGALRFSSASGSTVNLRMAHYAATWPCQQASNCSAAEIVHENAAFPEAIISIASTFSFGDVRSSRQANIDVNETHILVILPSLTSNPSGVNVTVWYAV
eukprot:TRINITY_DN44618_c0_g1_i1.p1 TRINITY_DN44618_c0_g1~~TRINITY_DN44618_c0_g1_i1.p1  ORF type:complete len:845 (+),score=100.16 TRINITY_DN44618_c0_g1_i1:22-2535(+)